MTPNRPDATCLTALRRRSPFGSGVNRAGSSPPSPVFDLPPMRFMAMARVSWASALIEPNDIAPVENRLKIDSTGSTSSRGIGAAPGRSRNSPRRVARLRFWSLTSRA